MLTEKTSYVHTLPLRVYYEDTDAGGVVFYANYLKFFERARTEWLRELKVHQSTLSQQMQLLFMVKKVEIEYIKPAALDYLLDIRSQITSIGGASIHFHQEAWHQDQQLCKSKVIVVCVDAKTMQATRIPSSLRSILENTQD